MTPFKPLRARFNRSPIEKAVRAVGVNTVKTARDGFRGPHSGRRYVRSGRTHTASAPLVEYPARDTGALDKGTSWTMRGTLSVEAGATVRYAVYLTHGTSRMQRRKMFDTALKFVAPVTLRAMPQFAGFAR